MQRKYLLSLSMIAALGFAMLTGGAFAQQKSLKEQLVGTWIMVSAETTNPDGTKFLPFGPNPKGIMVLDAAGNYVGLNASSSLPKVASNNRNTATADENKAITQGTLASFGTYTVNEADQMRPIKSISPDELSYANPAPTTGAGVTILTYKRSK
jgi:hypothetical protein